MSDRSHANNETLREIMREHSLSRSQASRLCMVRDSTLDRWLAPPTRDGKPNPQYRRMPGQRLALMEHALSRTRTVSGALALVARMDDGT